MSKKIIHRAHHFKSEASPGRDAVTVIFDISGFSKFFNQPDVHSYIPRYLNHIVRCVEINIFGGTTSWRPEGQKHSISPLSLLPVHRKFLGDGMLYVFARTNSAPKDPTFVLSLINRLWNVQSQFSEITSECSRFVPVAELPSAIRIGIARGTAYELSVEKTHDREYIGFCMNLASRVQ